MNAQEIRKLHIWSFSETEIEYLKFFQTMLSCSREPLHCRTRIVIESSFVDKAEAPLAQQVCRIEVVGRGLQHRIGQATWRRASAALDAITLLIMRVAWPWPKLRCRFEPGRPFCRNRSYAIQQYGRLFRVIFS